MTEESKFWLSLWAIAATAIVIVFTVVLAYETGRDKSIAAAETCAQAALIAGGRASTVNAALTICARIKK